MCFVIGSLCSLSVHVTWLLVRDCQVLAKSVRPVVADVPSIAPIVCFIFFFFFFSSRRRHTRSTRDWNSDVCSSDLSRDVIVVCLFVRLCRNFPSPFWFTRGLDPAAQHFSDTPCLGNTAARRERRFGIENLTDRSDAGFVQVRPKADQKVARAGAIVQVDLEPGINERPDQPGPDGSLMISRIASPEIAEILGFVIRMIAAERAQTNGGEQFFAYDLEDRIPVLLIEH